MANYADDSARNDACLLMATCMMPSSDEIEHVGTDLKEHYNHLKRLEVAASICGEALDYSSLLFEEQHDKSERNTDEYVKSMETKSFWRHTGTGADDTAGEKTTQEVVIKSDSIDFGALPDYDQARKDIERDRVVINGTFFSGAEVGFLSLQKHVNSLISSVLENEFGSCSALLERKIAEISEMVLIKASRTLTGGASYSALATKVSEYEQPIPISSLASPIGLRIGLDATPHKVLASTFGRQDKDNEKRPAKSLSLSVDIEASTVFLIKSFADERSASSSEEDIILVRYNDRMLLPLSLVHELHVSEVAEGGEGNGVLEMVDSVVQSRENAEVSMTKHPTITSSSPPYFSPSA